MNYVKEYRGTGVVRTGRDVVHGAELVAMAASEIEDPERTRGLRWVLIDLTDTTKLDASTEDIRAVAMHNMATATYAPRLVIAVVAPRDAVFGVVRMWEGWGRTAQWQTRVFRARDEAEEWLREVEPTFG